MRRYVMKQKFLSLGPSFTIKDQDGADVYEVQGQPILGLQLSIRDMGGNEVASIQRKLLSFVPTFEVRRGGQLAAVVSKQFFTLFSCKFTVDVPGPDDLEASGDLFDMEYTFTRGGRMAATVSKQWFDWTDTYGVEVMDGEDDVLILASCAVIDLACHGGEDHGFLGLIG